MSTNNLYLFSYHYIAGGGTRYGIGNILLALPGSNVTIDDLGYVKDRISESTGNKWEETAIITWNKVLTEVQT